MINNKGESIVEVLCAALIIVLAVSVFSTGIESSFKLNGKAKQMDNEFIEETNIAEAGSYSESGTVMIDGNSINVEFLSEDAEFISYKLSGDD